MRDFAAYGLPPLLLFMTLMIARGVTYALQLKGRRIMDRRARWFNALPTGLRQRFAHIQDNPRSNVELVSKHLVSKDLDPEYIPNRSVVLAHAFFGTLVGLSIVVLAVAVGLSDAHAFWQVPFVGIGSVGMLVLIASTTLFLFAWRRYTTSNTDIGMSRVVLFANVRVSIGPWIKVSTIPNGLETYSFYAWRRVTRTKKRKVLAHTLVLARGSREEIVRIPGEDSFEQASQLVREHDALRASLDAARQAGDTAAIRALDPLSDVMDAYVREGFAWLTGFRHARRSQPIEDIPPRLTIHARALAWVLVPMLCLGLLPCLFGVALGAFKEHHYGQGDVDAWDCSVYARNGGVFFQDEMQNRCPKILWANARAQAKRADQETDGDRPGYYVRSNAITTLDVLIEHYPSKRYTTKAKKMRKRLQKLQKAYR